MQYGHIDIDAALSDVEFIASVATKKCSDEMKLLIYEAARRISAVLNEIRKVNENA